MTGQTEAPGDLIRRAAAVLRERAGAATQGRWQADYISCPAAPEHDCETINPVDADYIATVDPVVGLAQAALLERMAELADAIWGTAQAVERWPWPCCRCGEWEKDCICGPAEALALARAILREEASAQPTTDEPRCDCEDYAGSGEHFCVAKP